MTHTAPAPDSRARTRRSGFGPTVLVGLAAGALVAVAGNHAWVSYAVRPAQSVPTGSDIGQVPLAAALGFVVLAAWGVLLVTRRVVRRAFAVLAVLASAGLLACVVWALVALPGDVRAAFPGSGSVVTTHFSGWLYAAALGVVVSLLTTVTAVRRVGGWPEMGQRYDAPTATGASAAPTTAPGTAAYDPDDPEAGNLELWRSIDRGQDPTA